MTGVHEEGQFENRELGRGEVMNSIECQDLGFGFWGKRMAYEI